MKSMLVLAVLFVFTSCRGSGTPDQVLPRIIKGDCVRISLQTRAGDSEDVLVIENLQARVNGGSSCGKLARIEIGGWVDGNQNARIDPGEAIDTTKHFPPGGASDEMTLENIRLKVPQGDLKALKVAISVYFTSSRTTHLEVSAR